MSTRTRTETPAVLTLAEAAEMAKVGVDDVRRWIREGLRATPVGRVGKRGPSDFRIFDCWLIQFLEQRSVAASPRPPAPADPPAVVTPKGPGRSGLQPLGPCPKPKG